MTSPRASCPANGRATDPGYAKVPPVAVGLFRAPDWIRTNDTGFRRAVLYPLSYEGNETLVYAA